MLAVFSIAMLFCILMVTSQDIGCGFLASLLDVEFPKLEETEGKEVNSHTSVRLSEYEKCTLCLLEAEVELAFNCINI